MPVATLPSDTDVPPPVTEVINVIQATNPLVKTVDTILETVTELRSNSRVVELLMDLRTEVRDMNKRLKDTTDATSPESRP